MPIYTFKCPACGNVEDKFVRMSDKPQFFCSCTTKETGKDTEMEKQVTSHSQFKFTKEGGAEKGRRWQ
jgi:putative FmdB family regulatory protein